MGSVTDVSYADGDIVNIVAGAVIAMPWFVCATKAIAHLFSLSFELGHQMCETCNAIFQCASSEP